MCQINKDILEKETKYGEWMCGECSKSKPGSYNEEENEEEKLEKRERMEKIYKREFKIKQWNIDGINNRLN